ncbi:uncharacterized protein GLRG_00646, partial [Colletotrichum graminicola M1.001]
STSYSYVLSSNCPSILQDRSKKEKKKKTPPSGHPPLATAQFSMLPIISHVRSCITNPKPLPCQRAGLRQISSVKKNKSKRSKKISSSNCS